MPEIPHIPKKIEALLDPNAYPESVKATEKIELVQTHISYVLLTDNFAYKIKKPVDFGFLNFTTLESRRHFCIEEVRLNRRLAPSLYIGVVEVTERNGVFRIDESEKDPDSTIPCSAIIDYAVKMRRIPKGGTLEELIGNKSVTPEIIRKVAKRIADFHYPRSKKSEEAGALTDERISGFGAPEIIKANTDENFVQTKNFIGTLIPEETYGLLKVYTDNFLLANLNLFKARAAGGFIRDCHGDIHAEHVILTSSGDIEIFDCIEFSERFRLSDTVAEIAFLSMDLDFRGRPLLAQVLEESYFSATGDSSGRKLLNFYKTYRAYIRGKVEGFKYNEPEVPEEEKAFALFNARHHFYLARRYANGCTTDCVRPGLIVVRGLSGTGKSAIAAKIGDLLGATVISSDRVRKELAGVDTSEHRYEEFGRGIYSTGFTEKTYKEMHSRAGNILASGLSCVLDATYSLTARIDAARSLTGNAESCPFHIIEAFAPEETILKRIENRVKREAKTGDAVSDADRGIYMEQKKIFEPLKTKAVRVDTTLDAREVFDLIATEIFG